MRLQSVAPEFVEFIPSSLDYGKLYISMTYSTTVHLCACGCGNKVVLPLSPAEWQLFYDGDGLDISPSVGNGEFPCRSHYWIRGNEIRWSTPLTKKQIAASRRKDATALSDYFSGKECDQDTTQRPAAAKDETRSFVQRFRDWLRI